VTRVAVTTARESAERAAAALRRHRLVPVLLPCIRIEGGDPETLTRLRAAAEGAAWILLTSARAVDETWGDGPMPPTPVAAVGAATARAVDRRGGEVHLLGRSGAADLVDRLGDGAGARIAFPRADGADPTTVRRLTAAGWEVVDGVAYRTVPVPPADDPVDAVAFASPSAIVGWCEARSLDDLVVAAIGPTTRAALVARGRDPDVVADSPSHTRLAAALARRLSGRITS
jgi:uroporphyrinogen-III synthase